MQSLGLTESTTVEMFSTGSFNFDLFAHAIVGHLIVRNGWVSHLHTNRDMALCWGFFFGCGIVKCVLSWSLGSQTNISSHPSVSSENFIAYANTLASLPL